MIYEKNCPAYPVSWFGIRVGAFYDSLPETTILLASSAATNSSASSAAASSSAVESDSSEASAGALPGKFATIEEFVNSDIMQEQIDSITSSLKDSGMNIKITGEGDKLVLYVYL